ncbi:hypothetical protein [Gimesia maris]|uniref:hypothetical protein n=1 Tax=Gimesia maris TaxID=122 RepID=UPI0012B9BD8B|nr:hypothetical protein [Gimesia maris]
MIDAPFAKQQRSADIILSSESVNSCGRQRKSVAPGQSANVERGYFVDNAPCLKQTGLNS